MSGKRESAESMWRGSRRSYLGEPKHAMRRRVNCLDILRLLAKDMESLLLKGGVSVDCELDASSAGISSYI